MDLRVDVSYLHAASVNTIYRPLLIDLNNPSDKADRVGSADSVLACA